MEGVVKTCSKCGAEKSINEFETDNRQKSGKGSNCLECKRERGRAYAASNKERMKEYKRLYRLNSENREKINKAERERLKKPVSARKRKESRSKYLQTEKGMATIVRNRLNWYENNPQKRIRYYRLGSQSLSDWYIRQLLLNQDYPKELVNNEDFIEVKRLIIKTKRLCKTLVNCEQV
ncbi:hypothetical protein [Spirosoma sp. 48-14]|uniref:hypothetical protein n=1 Tax=Spirosoma sp. 48-14 TaxID=1895854 RepID=UPI0025EA3B40|nr:hypothetical protein [Spirosoma sp. 48-14]